MFNKRKQQSDESASQGSNPPSSPTDKIAAILDNWIEMNESKKKNEPNIFECKTATSVTVKDYLLRMTKYARIYSVSHDDLLIAVLMYVDRFVVKQSYRVNKYNIHRLLLSAFICATKFYCDDSNSNSYMAKVGGVTNLELNELEAEFLFFIEFDLMITDREFREAKKIINNYISPQPVIVMEVEAIEAKPTRSPM